jgi:cytochrome c peroxidase
MHNGVFETLEQVVDFYDAGGGHGLGIDLPHQTLPTDSLHLSREEKGAVVAFMKALTDTARTTARPPHARPSGP